MLVRLIELLKSLNIVAIENNLKVYLGHHLEQNRLFRENFKNLNSEDPFYIIRQKLELLDNFVKNFHDIVVRQEVKSNIIFNRVSVELKNKRIEVLQDSGVLFLELLNIIDTVTLDYSKKISKLVYAADAIHSIQDEAKKDIIMLDKTIHRRFIKNKKPINKKMLLFLLQKAKKASTKDDVVLKESLCLLNNYQQILSQLCLLGDFIANFVLYINSQLHRNKVLNFEEAPRRLLFLKTRMPHKDFVPRTHLMAARLLFYVERAKFANILPRDHGLRLFFKSLVFTKELSLAFSFTDSMKITKDLQQEVGYLQSVLDFDDNIAYKKKKKQFNLKHKRGYWAGLLRTINNLNNLNSTVVNVNEKLLSTLKDELKAELWGFLKSEINLEIRRTTKLNFFNTVLWSIFIIVFGFGILWFFAPFYNYLCSAEDVSNLVQSSNEIKLAHKYIYLNPSDGNVDSLGQILMLPARHQESGIHSVFVKFLTTVDKELPLHFYAEQSYVRIKPGKSCLAFLQIANFTLHEFHVSTSYAVVPKFDSYFFKKLQCFCFDDQVIKPRSVTEVPIVFFLDNEAMHGAGFNDRHKNIAVEYNLHPYTEVDSKKSLETYPKASMDDRMLVYQQTRKPLGVSWPHDWVDTSKEKTQSWSEYTWNYIKGNRKPKFPARYEIITQDKCKTYSYNNNNRIN